MVENHKRQDLDEQKGKRHGLSSFFTSAFFLNCEKEVIVNAAKIQHLASDIGYSLIVAQIMNFLKFYSKYMSRCFKIHNHKEHKGKRS